MCTREGIARARGHTANTRVVPLERTRARRKRDRCTENDFPAKRVPVLPPTLKSFSALLLLLSSSLLSLCSVNKLASVIRHVEHLGCLIIILSRLLTVQLASVLYRARRVRSDSIRFLRQRILSVKGLEDKKHVLRNLHAPPDTKAT